MKKLPMLAGFCIFVLSANAGRPQEPQPQQQGTQFNTGADPKEQARIELNRGVEQFKRGEYDAAANSFARAKQLDPQLLNARLYLATTYASQYVPGAPSEENLQNGKKSIEEFRGVLVLDPNNLNAIDGLGSLLFQMAGMPYDPKMFQESKSYHIQHFKLKPEDPEPLYWIGVIDWTLSYRGNADLRAKYNLEHMAKQVKDTDPLPESLRIEYSREFWMTIVEGIECLKEAITKRRDYDDAMAYLNLLYRRKADAVESKSERAQLLKTADDLVDQVIKIKQGRATSNQ
jgi:tetratricopeptide (TPR) repeat protein